MSKMKEQNLTQGNILKSLISFYCWTNCCVWQHTMLIKEKLRLMQVVQDTNCQKREQQGHNWCSLAARFPLGKKSFVFYTKRLCKFRKDRLRYMYLPHKNNCCFADLQQ